MMRDLLVRLAGRAPNYVKAFGPVHGSRLLFTNEVRARDGKPGVVEVTLPGDPVPCYLRRNRADASALWQCLVTRQYDIADLPQWGALQSAYEEKLSAGEAPLIIDCGANIGLASRWFADRFPQARVISVEPDGENVRMAERNLAHFGDRVQVLPGGIWNEPGELVFTDTSQGPMAFRVDRPADGQTGAIRCWTIGEICDMAGVETPFIVKIDIEGAQKALFASNTDWVAGAAMISIELEDWLLPWQGTSKPFFEVMSRHDFDYVMQGENMFCFSHRLVGAR